MRRQVQKRKWLRLFGARQSGKSTSLEQLQHTLNATPDHVCLSLSFQHLLPPHGAEPMTDEEFNMRVRTKIENAIDASPHRGTFDGAQVIRTFETAKGRPCTFTQLLSLFVRHVDPTGASNRTQPPPPPPPPPPPSSSSSPGRAVVLAIDDFDCLPPAWSAHILSALREWYHESPGCVPRSIILCGVVDVTLRLQEDGRPPPSNITASFHPSP
jgi:hypothetical protein